MGFVNGFSLLITIQWIAVWMKMKSKALGFIKIIPKNGGWQSGSWLKNGGKPEWGKGKRKRKRGEKKRFWWEKRRVLVDGFCHLLYLRELFPFSKLSCFLGLVTNPEELTGWWCEGKTMFDFPLDFFFKSVMYPLPFSNLLTLIHLVILDSSCMLMANALSSWGVFIVGLLVFSFFFVVCLFDLARNGWMRGFLCSVWGSWIEGRYEIHSVSDNWPYEISANGYEWGF